MIDFNYLPRTDKILISLLESRCCTSKQIKHTFEYASIQSAYNILNELKKKGYLYNVKAYRGNSGYAFFLTNKGSEYALSCVNKPAYILDNGKLIPQFNTQGENKYNPSFLSHAISVSDFYYSLLKSCGYGNFNWYLEKDTILNSEDQKIIVRGDASFNINDNEKYILEQDMGTMTKAQTQRKFNHYAQILSEQDSYPTILFSINLDVNPSRSEYVYGNIQSIKSLEKEVTYLKKRLEEVEYAQSIISDFEHLSREDIMRKRDEIKELLSKHSKLIKPSELKRCRVKLEQIDSYLNSASIQKPLSDIYNLYKAKHQELNNLKKEAVNIAVEKKTKLRLQNIKDILLTSDDRKSYDNLYSLMLAGLNIYVNSQDNVIELVTRQVILKKKNIDLITQYLKNTLVQKYQRNTNIKVQKSSNRKIMFGPQAITSNRSISVSKSGNVAANHHILIEDVSFKNIGAYVRTVSMAQNMKEYNDYPIARAVIIVDDEDQAKEISREVENSYNNAANFAFIDKDELMFLTQNPIQKDVSLKLEGLEQSFYQIIKGQKIEYKSLSEIDFIKI
ncbi:MAG: replication-relaxation family protein [Clostridia bacterium]